jgi:hypothetical protein
VEIIQQKLRLIDNAACRLVREGRGDYVTTGGIFAFLWQVHMCGMHSATNEKAPFDLKSYAVGEFKLLTS